MPKISFVIPTRNRADMVVEALRSLQAQTEKDWEAVVVDDHSDDETQSVVDALQDGRIRYYDLPDNRGQGVASARNYGNLLAKAKLIAVLDSDDLAKPDRAEVALASFAKEGWDFYSARRETTGKPTTALAPPKTLPDKWDPELFKTASFVTHSTVVYTKKAALEIPYNSALPCLVDYDLISRFIEAGKKIYYDAAVVTVWRRHGDTLTGSIPQHQRMKYLQSIRSWRGWTNDAVDPEELA